ncbi:hypothetical protein FQZ97_1274020 [compost metagenome]
MVTLRLEKSRCLNSGWSISATNRVFRPSSAEKRHFFSSLMKPPMSRGLVIRMLWLPLTIMHMQFAVKA